MEQFWIWYRYGRGQWQIEGPFSKRQDAETMMERVRACGSSIVQPSSMNVRQY